MNLLQNIHPCIFRKGRIMNWPMCSGVYILHKILFPPSCKIFHFLRTYFFYIKGGVFSTVYFIYPSCIFFQLFSQYLLSTLFFIYSPFHIFFILLLAWDPMHPCQGYCMMHLFYCLIIYLRRKKQELLEMLAIDATIEEIEQV